MGINAADLILKIKNNISMSFAGKDAVLDNLLCCLLSEGHVLLEDVPGVGKTTLALSLVNTIKCSFGRTSFTPDTLPSDVTGLSIYNSATKAFEFVPGPVMNQIYLADEINRTPPKTQAALLEAMQEKKVTVDAVTRELDKLFMVIATQNPVEFMGTYPLPEAQLDRFTMKLSLGYPTKEDELKLATMFLEGRTPDKLESVCSVLDILELQEQVKKVTIKENVLKYIQNIINATRTDKHFLMGASPRAMLALIRTSQAKALMDGRDYVKPDDIKKISIPVLLHRLPLSVESRMSHEDPETILKSLIATVEVPT